jgi:hypothetical protein
VRPCVFLSLPAVAYDGARFSADGTRLISAGRDGALCVYDVTRDYQVIAMMHDGCSRCVASHSFPFAPSHRCRSVRSCLAQSHDGALVVCVAAGGRRLSVLSGPLFKVRCNPHSFGDLTSVWQELFSFPLHGVAQAAPREITPDPGVVTSLTFALASEVAPATRVGRPALA